MTPDGYQAEYLRLFQQLNRLMLEYAYLWRPVPFRERNCQWQAQAPQLYAAVMALDAAQIARLQGNDSALYRALEQKLPVLKSMASLTAIKSGPAPAMLEKKSFWIRHIPGRKLDQIRYFAAGLETAGDQLLDWCCGKGHLGRHLCQLHGTQGWGIEYDPTLVDAGNRLSERDRVRLRLASCDVNSEPARGFIHQSDHAVALHACGGLHRRLLELVTQQRLPRVSLSPCCYHRYITGNQYTPLSSIAANSGLLLSQDELRGAVRQSSTSSVSAQKKRAQLQSWRLGFDQLQRDLQQTDRYLPLPPLAAGLLHGGFSAFCSEVAKQQQISLPQQVDFSHYEQLGNKRMLEVMRLDLVRMLFRRPLELWLVLDQLLYLNEHGYQCDLRQFCPPQLTPRNLLLDARLG